MSVKNLFMLLYNFTLLEDMVIFIRTGEFSGQEKMNSEMSPDSSPLGSFSAMKLWRLIEWDKY